MAGPSSLASFGCCSGGGGGSCLITFNVSVCGGAGCLITVTITQTSGGSYTATQTGSSPFIFGPGIPCGTYNYSISAPGSPGIIGSVTVTSTATVNKTFSTPPSSFCGCCPCRWFPDTLHLTSAYGAVTLTWDGSFEWQGCQTISYPGYTEAYGPGIPPCVPMTLSITLCHSVSCTGVSGGVATFEVGESWVIGSDFSPFPVPDGSICCPLPDLGEGNIFRGNFSTTVTNPCGSPIDLSYFCGTQNPFCDLPIGTVTITE